LIARLHGLFTLAPAVMAAVAVIGLVTLLLAAFSALVQRDIKRVLAYSTISQIGYMFLALGVGAWSAALFHFLTHACFKALLFLSAGAVILSVHHEQDIFRMGGLRRHSPVVFWTFLAGAAALSGLPLITAGFYSKDWILWSVWSSPQGGSWLWIGGALGAFLTALYSFRLVFRVFFGASRTEARWIPGRAIRIPLLMLALLSLTVGFLEVPATLGGAPLFSDYLSHALPAPRHAPDISFEATQQLLVTGASLAGVALAAWLFLARRPVTDAAPRHSAARALAQLWLEGWGFDRFYDRWFVRPWHALTRETTDRFDGLYEGLAGGVRRAHYWLTVAQTGRVRWYAASVAAGALVLLGLFAL
jgi:NADH-quinone oxidoreductase subunit L